MMFVALLVCLLLCIQLSVTFNIGMPMRSRHAVSKVAKMCVPASTPAVEKIKVKKHVIRKPDLLTTIQAQTSFKKTDIERVLNAFITVIHDEVLQKGAELRLRDFGAFKQKTTAPRATRNPRTGEYGHNNGTTTVLFTGSAGTFKIKN